MGTPVRTYTYDTFGTLVAETGTLPNPFTYTAREFDPETGLLYYRARYYDPSIGRFLSEDPIGLDGGDVNFYTYVFNNPLSWVDPYGLQVMVPGSGMRVRPGSDVSIGVDIDNVLPGSITKVCSDTGSKGEGDGETNKKKKKKKNKGKGGPERADEIFDKVTDPKSRKPADDTSGGGKGTKGKTRDGRPIRVRHKPGNGGARIQIEGTKIIFEP